MKHDIILLESQTHWARDLVEQIEQRGWYVFWTPNIQEVYQHTVTNVYLLSLSHPQLKAEALCHWIRQKPKGENVSIFLLNDGSHPLKSFEAALRVGADALYFVHNQLPLLLSNFPHKNKMATLSDLPTPYSLKQERYTPSLAQAYPQAESPTQVGLPNQNRVVGISLTHLQKERDSFGYSTKTHLLLEQIQQAMKSPPPSESVSEHSSKVNQYTPKINEHPSRVITHNHIYTHQTPISSHAQSSHSQSSRSQSSHSQSSRSQSIHSQSSRTQLASHSQSSRSQSASHSQSSRTQLASHSQSSSQGKLSPRGYMSSEIHQEINLRQVIETPAITPSPSKREMNVSLQFESTPIPPPFYHTTTMEQDAVSDMDIIQTARFEWAQILAEVVRNRQACCLVIEYQQETWEFFIQKNIFRDLQGNHYNQYLINLAYNKGLFSHSIVEKLHTQPKDFDLIDYIIDQDLMSIADLEQLMQDLALSQFYRFFDVTQARYQIKKYHQPPDNLFLAQSLLRLLIHGVSQHYGRLKLYKCFTHHKSVPISTGLNVFYHQFEPYEQYLLQSCARKEFSIAEIADKHQLSVNMVLSFYYVCYLLGEVTLQQDNPLMNYYQRLISQDYFQILSLPYESNGHDAQVAWRQHRQWLAQQYDDQVDTKVMIDILDDAYRVLAHDVMRQRYLHSLQNPMSKSDAPS